VLSAHLGPSSAKGNQLQALRPGDRIAVMDARGDWIGGYAPALLLAQLPGGQALRIDGEDCGRGADQLVLYHPGYGNGHTGTNQYGVEIAVRDGKVADVRDQVGDMPIPADGYVLSAHGGGAGSKADALRALKPGDTVRLLLEKGGQRHDLTEALAERRQVYPVGGKCHALYLAMNTEASSSPGTPLGEWVVDYADGTQARIPVRYGLEALPQSADALPQETGGPAWLIDRPPLRCLVREWQNPRPEQPIRQIRFEPAPALLDMRANLVAATAAVAP
jgi:hypothetical protein